jgi:F-type H+-transporting ATPase subunit delta
MSSTEARTYARALYETLIANTVEQLRQATTRLGGAAPTAERIAAALPSGAAPELHNFLTLLARDGAVGQLTDISDALESYILRGGPQTLDAEVTSAVALSEVQQARITADLRQRYGDQLAVSFAVDPELIGGLIIRVGDQVLDNSLRTRLSAVQRTMMTS